jgi:hypothetical protein
MNKKLHKLLVAVPVAVAVTAGGIRIAADYQKDGFQPFATDNQLKNDQLLFADNNASVGAQQKKTKDDSFWERDDSKKEQSEAGKGSGYLFEQQNQTIAGGDSVPGQSSSGLSSIPDGSVPSGIAGDVIYDVVGDPSQADTIISGGGTSGSNGSGGQTPGNGGTTTPDKPSNDNGNNTNPGGNNNGGGQTPDNDKPSNGGNKDNGGNAAPTPTPSLTPGYADFSKDPESPKEEPSDSGWGNTTNVPIDSNSPRPSDDPMSTVYLNISMPYPCPLYWKQSVDALTIFRALDTYVTATEIDADYNLITTNYYWGESQFNKLFRIDSVSFDGGETYTSAFPVTIPENLDDGDMQIQVSYRYDTSEGWVSKTIGCTPSSALLYVLPEQLTQKNETIDISKLLNISKFADTWYKTDLYPSAGSKVNLLQYQEKLLGSSTATLDKLFPGWVEDNQIVPFIYPVTGGRHVLEPASLVDYNSSLFDVRLTPYYVDTDYTVSNEVAGDLCKLQTLMDYNRSNLEYQSIDRLVVPQYVQTVNLIRLFGAVETNDLVLPSSVIYVNTDNPDSLSVKQNYIVDSANPRYASQNGILYNKDMTELLAVPSETAELEIPASVESVTLPENNQLTKLTFLSTDPNALPKVNFDQLADGSKIIVEPGVLSSFLETYQQIIYQKGLQVSTSDAPDITYTIENGMVIRNDGSLSGLFPSNGNVLYLPDGIDKIDSANLGAQGNIDTIVMPSSGKITPMDSDLFSKGGIQNVVCYTKEQADAVRAIAPAEVNIQMVATANGYTYFTTTAGAVILTAPADITEFNGTELGDGISVCAISSYAFEKCQKLAYVTLPESVKRIGSQAFYGCGALEGILIDSKDSIVIGDKAWDNCPTLRFVASNAQKAVRQNDYDPSMTVTFIGTDKNSLDVNYQFCLKGNEGYSSHWDCFEKDPVTRFTMVDVGDGHKVLYGVDDSEYGEGTWLALRAGKNMPASVTLPTDTYWIYAGAFADTASPGHAGYALNWTDLPLNQPGSFYNFGLQDYAFAHSDLAGDVTMSGNIYLSDYVFAYCKSLNTVDLTGTISHLGNKLFTEDEKLTGVRFGAFAAPPSGGRNDLTNRQFTGCSSLRTVEFTSTTPPSLAFEGMSDPYMFNSDWTDAEEQENLKIIVPEGCKQTYLDAWHYAFAGYEDTSAGGTFIPAYQSLRNATKRLPDCKTDAEVDAAIYDTLLKTNNRLRGLLGMDSIENLDHLYNWKTTLNDLLIMTSAYTNAEEITLDSKTMELPDGWTLDYIGAQAFHNAPNLTHITADASMDGGLFGIYSGAFAGAPHDITLTLSGNADDVVGLVPADDGKPFDFSGLTKVEIPEGSEQTFLNFWIYPASGYEDYADLYLRTADALFAEDKLTDDLEENKMLIDNRMAETMLPYENQLRTLFGMEQTDELTVDLGEYTPDIPDNREWGDLVPGEDPDGPDNPGDGDNSGEIIDPDNPGDGDNSGEIIDPDNPGDGDNSGEIIDPDDGTGEGSGKDEENGSSGDDDLIETDPPGKTEDSNSSADDQPADTPPQQDNTQTEPSSDAEDSGSHTETEDGDA